jgi:hypothetical protein
MTHPLLKEPLERWLPAMLFQAMALAAWLGVDHLYKRKQESEAKPYRGGPLLLPEYSSGKHQEALDAALKWAGVHHSMTASAMIQKIQEWTVINLAKNRPDPRPYYTFKGWCREHFPGLNFASMQRLVKSLRDLGVISTERDPDNNNCYRYAVNQAEIDALLDRWAAAHPDAARKFRGEDRRIARESSRLAAESSRIDYESSSLAGESSRLKDESHTSSNQFNKRNWKNQSGIKARSAGERRGAARSLTEALTEIESHSHMQKSGDIDLKEPLALDDQHQAEERTDTSLPSSEAPSLQMDEASLDAPFPDARPGSRVNTPRTVWTCAYAQLAAQFDRPSFEMWLKKAQLLAYESGCYTVGVPTKHAQDMLQHRYYRNIQRVVEGLRNQPVQIRFEVLPPQGGR